MINRMRPWQFLTLAALVGLNAYLAFVTYDGFFGETHQTNARPVKLAEERVALASISPQPDLARYSQTITQPIFFQFRSPFVPPPPKPVVEAPKPARPPPPPIADPDFTLSGIMEIRGAQKAFLTKKSGQVGVWVSIGDEMSGWRVQSIDPAGVGLRNGARDFDLRLYKEK